MVFDDYGLQRELKEHWKAGRTGTLTCDLNGYQKKLFIKAGLPCFATSDDPDDKLHAVLIGQGCFSDDQFKAAEPNFKEDISIGRNLVEMGLIEQKELVGGAQGQIYSIFASAMHAKLGDSEFEEGDLPSGVVSLPLNLPNDFYRTIFEMEDKTWISNQFGDSLDFVPARVADNPVKFSALKLDDFAEPLYDLIDGDLNFNHLAFEADVDDFLLLKFLYVLKLLGHITITEDEDEVPAFGDDFDVDGARNDLSEAMQQRDELESMRDTDETSMDETVSLSSASMDATTEISRSFLNEDSALGMDETSDIPRPEGLEPENLVEDEDEDEPTLDDEFAKVLDAEEGKENGEALGVDPFEEEMEKMNAPLDIPVPDDPAPNESVEEDGEGQEDTNTEPEDANGGSKQKRRLLLLTAVGLISVGLLFLMRPYLLQFNPLGQTLAATEQTADETTQDARGLEPDSVEPSLAATEDKPALSTVDGDPGQGDSKEPGEAKGNTKVKVNSDPSNKPPKVKTADPIQPEPSTQTVLQPAPSPEKDQPAETTLTESKPSSQNPASITQGITSGTFLPKGNGRLERNIHSPVAEGWDSDTWPPNGYQAPVHLPRKQSSQAPEVVRLAANANPTQIPPQKKQSASQNRVKKSPPSKLKTRNAPNKKGTAKSAETQSGSGSESAAKMLGTGDFPGAARQYHRHFSQSHKKFTLGLLGCETETMEQAQSYAARDSSFFILAWTFKGRPCYWVCRGSYATRREAMSARKKLPPELKSDKGVKIRLIDKLLERDN